MATNTDMMEDMIAKLATMKPYLEKDSGGALQSHFCQAYLQVNTLYDEWVGGQDRESTEPFEHDWDEDAEVALSERGSSVDSPRSRSQSFCSDAELIDDKKAGLSNCRDEDIDMEDQKSYGVGDMDLSKPHLEQHKDASQHIQADDKSLRIRGIAQWTEAPVDSLTNPLTAASPEISITKQRRSPRVFTKPNLGRTQQQKETRAEYNKRRKDLRSSKKKQGSKDGRRDSSQQYPEQTQQGGGNSDNTPAPYWT